ncbi:hypothetical protein C4579_02110 [Candidatus Microgenomates bacterium]|nr:MAG: hypothetical protein C4579_02110 [Candidatus Microgenomates bacterium]
MNAVTPEQLRLLRNINPHFAAIIDSALHIGMALHPEPQNFAFQVTMQLCETFEKHARVDDTRQVNPRKVLEAARLMTGSVFRAWQFPNQTDQLFHQVANLAIAGETEIIDQLVEADPSLQSSELSACASVAHFIKAFQSGLFPKSFQGRRTVESFDRNFKTNDQRKLKQRGYIVVGHEKALRHLQAGIRFMALAIAPFYNTETWHDF